MCGYQYGFLRCEDGGLEGSHVPSWAMWCPKCNAPKMLGDALSYSLVAFQQALQICATASPEAARQWIVSVATWPARVDTVTDLGATLVTEQDALGLLSKAMDAAGHGQMIEIAAVANELHAIQRGMHNAGYVAMSDKIGDCRGRLNDLTKPKEHT